MAQWCGAIGCMRFLPEQAHLIRLRSFDCVERTLQFFRLFIRCVPCGISATQHAIMGCAGREVRDGKRSLSSTVPPGPLKVSRARR